MKTTLTRPAIVALTLVAVLLLALAPAQLALRKAVGSEPYPQLMMPSFGAQDARPNLVTARHLTLVGVRGDGTLRELDVDAILPRSQTLPMIIAGLQFQRRSVIEEPESISWLTQRIDAAYPDERFTALRIVWTEVSIEIPSGTQTSRVDDAASFAIDLRNAEEADR
ncbi:hypothetical protein ACFRFH_15760 [Leifsonia sp. NPDC056824]|uniref:hypothetical protein n=1 Tax=Leifsonia sp. NPDC056824 TaxID=3345953 RepID=UPI00367B71B6